MLDPIVTAALRAAHYWTQDADHIGGLALVVLVFALLALAAAIVDEAREVRAHWDYSPTRIELVRLTHRA